MELKKRKKFFNRSVKKYNEIANKYNVSISTFKQELISAYKKLGVCNQKEFIKKYGNIEIIEKAFNITKN